MASPSSPSDTSRAWTFTNRGLPSQVLSLSTRQTPTLPPPLPLPRDVPNPEEWLLIKTAFVGLNPGAIFQMTLVPQLIRKETCTPEMDLSGRVVDVWCPDGADPRFKKGDAVVAMLPAGHTLPTGTGALAEYVVVPARYVVGKPEGVSFGDAAGAMLPALTAWELVQAAKIKSGDRVLVNAAGGGIGTMVMQMVRNVVGKDGYIAGVCGKGKQDLVLSLGADEVIDYTLHQPLPSHLTTQFSASPLNAIIDTIGTQALYLSSLSYLVPEGIYSSVGVKPPNYFVPSFLRAVLQMKLNEYWPVSPWLFGVGRVWAGASVMEPTLEDRQRVVDQLGRGEIRVVRDSVREFEHAKEAYERLAEGHVNGKVLVRVDPGIGNNDC